MRRHVTSLVLPVALLSLMACGETPSQPDVPDPSFAVNGAGEWVDINLTTFDSCNDELVDWTTRQQIRTWSRADKSGGFHIGFHRTWVGTGVGQVTGTESILNWGHNVQRYFGGPFPQTFTRVIDNNIVTKGSAANRIFSLKQHITVNANGEVTVDHSEQKLVCVG